jgi:hypothetical protein
MPLDQGTAVIPIKDLLALAISFLALGLGIVNFYRAIRLERRVFIEPYFKRIWSEINTDLSAQIRHVDYWLSNPTNRDLARLLDVENPIKLDDLSSRYAKDMNRALTNYASIIIGLKSAIHDYNWLFDATSGELILAEGINDNTDENVNDFLKQRRANANEVARKYCPDLPNPTRKDVAGKLAYQRDLTKHKDAITAFAGQLRRCHEIVSSLFKVYTDKFASSAG